MTHLTLSDLRTRQAWPFNQKIDHTVGAIEAFVNFCKEHGQTPDAVAGVAGMPTSRPITPYVSFSGGLNSTVLLDIARRFVDRDMKGVFCSTGNEFPEIIQFVRHTENVEIIRPEITPREVLAQYGFPLVSKQSAQAVRQIRTTNSDKLRAYRLYGNGARQAGVLAEKWRYLVDEPYMTSEKCCEMLKKRPFRKYNARTNSLAMVGTMADESKLRQTMYVRRGGCNAFSDDLRKVHSAPLSIWTDVDCWAYIRRFNVPYSSIYDVPGIRRTGCMFCGFGAHMPGDCRFRVLFDLHLKVYHMAMNYTNNGITYRTALRRMGVELPDEVQRLF